MEYSHESCYHVRVFSHLGRSWTGLHALVFLLGVGRIGSVSLAWCLWAGRQPFSVFPYWVLDSCILL